MKITALLTAALAFISISASSEIYHNGWNDLDKNGKKDIYEDPSRPVAARVNDLLMRMTLGEKIGQLVQTAYGNAPDQQLAAQITHGEIGSFLMGGDPVMRNKLQRIAIEQSRLGIPLISGAEVLHGFRTIFPVPLAEACAWAPDLFERTQTIAALEAAAAGIDWTFAPNVDFSRDPRWGRIVEGFGEDPYLCALDAAACVRGFQGTNVANPDRIVSCLKHFVGYGSAEGGRDYNTTEISEFTLRNFYLPQFKAGVDAGALTVASAFNDLNGTPASGNYHTLTEILRNEWKFSGFVVSDFNAVSELIDHGVAADEAGAARLALTAGVDMEMVSATYAHTLKQQIQSGKIPEKILDRAVRRILTVKFEKGLFDHPYVDESRGKTAFPKPDALALAREAAAKSCVLLKNENGALPLSKQIKTLALIGPFADGMRAKLSTGTQVNMARGCAIIEPGTAVPWKELRGSGGNFARATGTNEIADAVALAKNADAVILALGEPSNWSGESSSRETLGLPGRQQELFDAVAATGKPVIVVLFNGRPLAIPQIEERAAAILEAWLPGTEGFNAVVDILFGEVDPSGRLTMTFPYSVGQVPIYYNYANTGRPGFGEWKGNYVDGPTAPLFPFGFGLAYTTFTFSNVELASPTVKMNGMFNVRVTIKNTGARAGTAVAELYIRDLACSVGARPVRELKGFQKILLQPGESREVPFTISAHALGCWDRQGHWIVEPGKFQLWISKDSATGTPAEFTVTE